MKMTLPQQRGPEGPRRNERLVLTCLRREGAASKPDVARRLSLTPQAVQSIMEGLTRAGLVEAGGRRGGLVGHPSTLYTIKPGGAYAIGIDVGARRLETALINFAGHMVYRGHATYPKLDRSNLAEAASEAIEAVLAHAGANGVEPERIAGIGVAASTAEVGTESVRAVLAPALQRVTDGRMPVFVGRRAVAEALQLSVLSPASTPANCLFLSVGQSVDGCLLLDGAVRNAEPLPGGAFGRFPVSAGGTVDEIAGLASLAARLGSDGVSDAASEDFFRATQARPAVLDGWLDHSAIALSTAIAAAHCLVSLDQVLLKVEAPASVGDRLGELVRDRLRARLGGACPPLHRVQAQPGSSALPAAAMALHELYAPGGGTFTATPANP